MKNLLLKCKDKKVKAFTLLEMLVVLIIISVLLLLFVPNLSKQKESVTRTGNAAVVKVVESQAELFELQETGRKASLSTLKSGGYITEKQEKAYLDYYKDSSNGSQKISS